MSNTELITFKCNGYAFKKFEQLIFTPGELVISRKIFDFIIIW